MTTTKELAVQIGEDLENLNEDEDFDVSEPRIDHCEDGEGDDHPHEVYVEVNGTPFSIIVKKV